MLLVLLACNADPSGDMKETVDFRDADTGPSSGERGTVHVSEVLWSGSVHSDGSYHPQDVFIEVRNEGNRAQNLSGWRFVVEGDLTKTFVIPPTDFSLDVGGHAFAVAKTDGCFPDPDYVIPDLELPTPGGAFEITLQDADERLVDDAGSQEMAPFSGGYDLVRSRSMERIELMFSADSTAPQMWHAYTPADVEVPNDDRIAPDCAGFTLASPGRSNSPDYSGAYATGSLD